MFDQDPLDAYLELNLDPVVNQPPLDQNAVMTQSPPEQSPAEPKVQIMKPTMDAVQEMYGMVIKDDFIEDALLRYPDLFNKFVEDAKMASENKMKVMLTDEQLSKYENLFPGLKNSTRKRKILSFLKLNPSFATVHPEILWQRINFYHMNYGSVSNSVNPVPEKPMREVIEKTLN